MCGEYRQKRMGRVFSLWYMGKKGIAYPFEKVPKSPEVVLLGVPMYYYTIYKYLYIK
jgi:hypothetical protein